LPATTKHIAPEELEQAFSLFNLASEQLTGAYQELQQQVERLTVELAVANGELRRQLLENNPVAAVLTLPGGVFQPYSGVKTSVLLFRKGGSTGRVLFLHADNDGYKLDANHDTPIEADDLPALVEVFKTRYARWAEWQAHFSPRPQAGEGLGERAAWTANWWFADAAEIRANDFNLSAGRYRPMNQTAIEHRDPRELLDELAAIEVEIAEEVEALRVALAEQAE